MLDGKIVLVTGASRGIGNAIALTLGKAGATVIGTATSEAGANNVSQMLDIEKISGKIVDQDGEALVGATVYVMELSTGSSTDIGGNYLFANIEKGNYSIVFSAVGYKKIKETIRKNKEIRHANSSRRMQYYLHKTRSQKQSSRAY